MTVKEEMMSPYPEELDGQLSRIREVLAALESHAEKTILDGTSDPSQRGARIALLADGGGHIWHAAEPEATDEELAKVVDALISHLEGYRDLLRGSATKTFLKSH
jgi:hypothetical protein